MVSTKEIPVWECKCEKCGHSWRSMSANLPAQCSKCLSRHWHDAHKPKQSKVDALHCRCNKCRHEWLSITKAPAQCVACYSRQWNGSKKRGRPSTIKALSHD
jgi:predicted Zn-ribbon and HTH transcriptional regulator